jgi:hypothetical protein
VEVLDGPQSTFSTASPCQFANPTKKGPSFCLQDVATGKLDPSLHLEDLQAETEASTRVLDEFFPSIVAGTGECPSTTQGSPIPQLLMKALCPPFAHYIPSSWLSF